MKCNVCGAINEDYLEYCEKCAAPLQAEASSESAPVKDVSSGNRSFVRSPIWSRPDFDANTISESDLPPEMTQSGKEAEAPAGPAPSAAASVAGSAAVILEPAAPINDQAGPAIQETVSQDSIEATAALPGSSCSVCGAKLIAGQRYCNNCRARVDDNYAADAAPAPQDNLQGANTYSAPAYSAPAYSQPSPSVQQPAATAAAASAWSGFSPSQVSSGRYPSGGDAGYDAYGEEDDSYQRSSARRSRSASAQRSSRSSKGSKSSKGSSRSSSRRGRSPSRKRAGGINTKLLMIAGGALAAVALLVFGIVMLVKSGIFSGSAITDEPVIEQTSTSNGEIAYNITVYAKKGSTVHFEGGTIVKDTPVSRKSVTYSIPEQIWIPNEPVEGTTIEVYPDITVINKKGESEAVTFAEPIIINVPSIDMTVTSPNTPEFSVTSPTVEIAGMVGDTTAAVYINDQQTVVDETGAFAYTYNLTEPGMNTLNVEARKNGYAIARSTFSIDYATGSSGGEGSSSGGAAANPGDTSAAKSIYYATTNDVNVRAEASSSSEKLGSLAASEKVYVVSADNNDWYKILFNNREAYVSGKYIKKVSDISSYSPSPATITGDGVNARASASSDSDRVDTLSSGTSVSLISQDNNGWSLVEYNGKIFYVSSSYVKKS